MSAVSFLSSSVPVPKVPPRDRGLSYAAAAVLAAIVAGLAFVALVPRDESPPPPSGPCTDNTDNPDFLALRWDRPYPASIAYARDRNLDGAYDANDDLSFWWWFQDHNAGARAVTDARTDDGRTGSVNEAVALLEDDLSNILSSGQINGRAYSCGLEFLKAMY